MTKRIAILAALVAVALTLAGCGFKPPAQWNETEERARALAAMNGWAEGVEEYDIDAMAGDRILAAGFKLDIYEGVTLGTKDKPAADLLRELHDDEQNQLAFRKSKAEGGAGYELAFDVDWEIDKIDKSSATVLGVFEVWETMEGGLGADVPGHIVDGWWNSDNGTIEVALVRTPNAWKITYMKIVFNAGVGAAARSLSGSVGLRIGKLPSMLGW
jgi:hypothetical protein